MSVPSAASAGWNALKARCCADPEKALRCTMVGLTDYAHSMDAALAVMAAEHSRRIEVALGRINDVRVRLRPFHPFDRTVSPRLLQELCTSLLAAMTELQALLSADKATIWASKLDRQP